MLDGDGNKFALILEVLETGCDWAFWSDAGARAPSSVHRAPAREGGREGESTGVRKIVQEGRSTVGYRR